MNSSVQAQFIVARSPTAVKLPWRTNFYRVRVDDSDDIRENITTFLELENYPVANANNGLITLKAVSQADHSLILLDMSMPTMNGFEFLSAYEQQLRPHTPVIVLSGENNIRVRKIPAFVVDVLPKPFALKYLLSRVQAYAQRL